MTIVVAGATGLAGSAIVRAYEKAGEEVIGINRSVCDLLDREATIAFLKKVKPAIVVALPPKLISVVPTVTLLFVKLAFGIALVAIAPVVLL